MGQGQSDPIPLGQDQITLGSQLVFPDKVAPVLKYVSNNFLRSPIELEKSDLKCIFALVVYLGI
jgi:hypothetical protein